MKSNRLRYLSYLKTAACFAVVAIGGSASIAAPATQPAAPTTQQSGRAQQAIMADLNTTSAELRSVLTSHRFLTDPKLRTELAPKAIPALNKMLSLFDELASVDANFANQAVQVKGQFLMMAALFGDEAAVTKLKAQAEGTDAQQVSVACSALYMVDWGNAANDAAAQTKVLDKVEAAAKLKPTDDALAEVVMEMAQQGPATPEIRQRAEKLVTDVFTGPRAKMAAEELASAVKLKSIEGKPLVLAGTKNDGLQFTTADWKGKVILVDFWATWCGPCRAELPRVKKAYADFHDKGLEVLGVSCDNNADALSKFLGENKDMPWPQLFDAKKPGWHELAKGFGIQGIPTMFLIDKQGVLRTIEARENFETLIPKMLEEK